MSLSIVWDSEDFEALGAIADTSNVLMRYLPDEHDASWHCLRFLDRWGQAIFNQIQLKWLLVDLKRLHDSIEPIEDKERVSGFIEFVRTAEGETHTFIRFIGD